LCVRLQAACRSVRWHSVWHAVQLALEGVQAPPPHAAVRVEPGVHLDERLGLQLVPPPLGVLADADEPCLPQDAQVLGGARLAEAETLDELTDRARLFAEEIENAATGGLGKGSEGGVGHFHQLI
jgi:hypothetical protein